LFEMPAALAVTPTSNQCFKTMSNST
jgi:hypothetical protein